MLRCQAVISENSEEDINNSSGGRNELRRGGWMTERVKETTSGHYLYNISSLSLLPMVHCTPGCTISSCIKRLSGRCAWRQLELRIAECIIAHQVSYYQSLLRNLQGKGLECNYYLGAHQASDCEWLWQSSILTLQSTFGISEGGIDTQWQTVRIPV